MLLLEMQLECNHLLQSEMELAYFEAMIFNREFHPVIILVGPYLALTCLQQT